eukprot:1139293-Pelagomonas_calceolata.AAC.16
MMGVFATSGNIKGQLLFSADIPTLEVPLHHLIELQPKADGTMQVWRKKESLWSRSTPHHMHIGPSGFPNALSERGFGVKNAGCMGLFLVVQRMAHIAIKTLSPKLHLKLSRIPST